MTTRGKLNTHPPITAMPVASAKILTMISTLTVGSLSMSGRAGDKLLSGLAGKGETVIAYVKQIYLFLNIKMMILSSLPYFRNIFNA